MNKLCAIQVGLDVFTILNGENIRYGIVNEDIITTVVIPQKIKPCTTECTEYIFRELGIEDDECLLNYYTYSHGNKRMGDRYLCREVLLDPVIVQPCDVYGNPVSKPYPSLIASGNGMDRNLIGFGANYPTSIEQIGKSLSYHDNIDPNGIIRISNVEDEMPKHYYSPFNYDRGELNIPASFVPKKIGDNK